jgi:hypothetical protein
LRKHDPVAHIGKHGLGFGQDMGGQTRECQLHLASPFGMAAKHALASRAHRRQERPQKGRIVAVRSRLNKEKEQPAIVRGEVAARANHGRHLAAGQQTGGQAKFAACRIRDEVLPLGKQTRDPRQQGIHRRRIKGQLGFSKALLDGGEQVGQVMNARCLLDERSLLHQPSPQFFQLRKRQVQGSPIAQQRQIDLEEDAFDECRLPSQFSG